MAYYHLEPFGEAPAYWRAGMQASTQANIHRPQNKSAYKPQDFMPREFSQSDSQNLSEQIKQAFRALEQ